MDGDKTYGALEVRAQTARGALPVCGARVFVARCGEGVSAAGVTDESGLSRTFELETERAEARAGERVPCARYDVEVIAPGFVPAEFHAVEIYEGVTSVVCAELIPALGEAPQRGGKAVGR